MHQAGGVLYLTYSEETIAKKLTAKKSHPQKKNSKKF